jgi:hypothetical protein
VTGGFWRRNVFPGVNHLVRLWLSSDCQHLFHPLCHAWKLCYKQLSQSLVVTSLRKSNNISRKRFLRVRKQGNDTSLTPASLLQERHVRFLISVRESGYTNSTASSTVRALARMYKKELLVQLCSHILRKKLCLDPRDKQNTSALAKFREVSSKKRRVMVTPVALVYFTGRTVLYKQLEIFHQDLLS